MIRSAQPAVVVFVDADNTLWDTDSVFATAQLNMLERVEKATGTVAATNDRLAYVRAVDQALAERHHAGLRYPPKLLVRGLEAALAGVPVERAARAARRGSDTGSLSDSSVSEIEQAFFDDLSRSPEIRTGVREGLEALQMANCLVLVITEGQRTRIEKTMKRLHLGNLVDRIIEGPKRPELYQRVLRLVGPSKRAFMVGDQLDRDIAPAKAAGLETIHFSGGFRPRWTPEEGLIQPDHQIRTFSDVSSIILADTRVPWPATR